MLKDGSRFEISSLTDLISSLIDVNSISIPLPLIRTFPASIFPFSSASTILKLNFSLPNVPLATMSFLINPSEIADSLIPDESIKTPLPVSSYKQKVKLLFVSRPIWILTTSFWSLNCIVFPTISSEPSFDLT